MAETVKTKYRNVHTKITKEFYVDKTFANIKFSLAHEAIMLLEEYELINGGYKPNYFSGSETTTQLSVIVARIKAIAQIANLSNAIKKLKDAIKTETGLTV
ncbi:MAG TPA: hypothetical protein VIH30_09160 [Aquirhabdus sp.]